MNYVCIYIYAHGCTKTGKFSIKYRIIFQNFEMHSNGEIYDTCYLHTYILCTYVPMYLYKNLIVLK